MNNSMKLVLVVAFISVLLLAGCSGGNEAAEAAAKYTDEVAQAIVEGSWKVAGAILLGFILNGLMS